jgi:hypothetical protein
MSTEKHQKENETVPDVLCYCKDTIKQKFQHTLETK